MTKTIKNYGKSVKTKLLNLMCLFSLQALQI
jgi:hypothetical protein